MKRGLKVASTLLVVSLSGCAMTSKAPDFSGLKDVDGSEAVHINMTKAALHFAVAMPLLGMPHSKERFAILRRRQKRRVRNA